MMSQGKVFFCLTVGSLISLECIARPVPSCKAGTYSKKMEHCDSEKPGYFGVTYSDDFSLVDLEGGVVQLTTPDGKEVGLEGKAEILLDSSKIGAMHFSANLLHSNSYQQTELRAGLAGVTPLQNDEHSVTLAHVGFNFMDVFYQSTTLYDKNGRPVKVKNEKDPIGTEFSIPVRSLEGGITYVKFDGSDGISRARFAVRYSPKNLFSYERSSVSVNGENFEYSSTDIGIDSEVGGRMNGYEVVVGFNYWNQHTSPSWQADQYDFLGQRLKDGQTLISVSDLESKKYYAQLIIPTGDDRDSHGVVLEASQRQDSVNYTDSVEGKKKASGKVTTVGVKFAY